MTILARRAYRGPVTAAEVETLMTFYQAGRKECDFEHGIEMVLTRILADPRFIYRIETEPASARRESSVASEKSAATLLSIT